MSGPPENSLLRRSLRQERDDELEGAAGLVGAMREIAVVAGGDEEHPEDDERETRGEAGPMKRDEENAEREQMNDRERESEKDRDARAVRERNRPIARESSHPASSSEKFDAGTNPAGAGPKATTISV